MACPQAVPCWLAAAPPVAHAVLQWQAKDVKPKGGDDVASAQAADSVRQQVEFTWQRAEREQAAARSAVTRARVRARVRATKEAEAAAAARWAVEEEDRRFEAQHRREAEERRVAEEAWRAAEAARLEVGRAARRDRDVLPSTVASPSGRDGGGRPQSAPRFRAAPRDDYFPHGSWHTRGSDESPGSGSPGPRCVRALRCIEIQVAVASSHIVMVVQPEQAI